MKKVMLIAALGMFVFTACKKDYTCSCKINGVAVGASTTIKDTKKNAESKCNEGDATVTSGGMTITTDCSI